MTQINDDFKLFKLTCLEKIVRVENEADLANVLEDIMKCASAREHLCQPLVQAFSEAPVEELKKEMPALSISVPAKSNAIEMVVDEIVPKMIRVLGAGEDEMNGVYMLAGRVNSKDLWRKKGGQSCSIQWDAALGWKVKSNGAGMGFYSKKSFSKCPPRSGYAMTNNISGPPPKLSWGKSSASPSASSAEPDTKQTLRQRKTSSNAYASGSNQNAGNVITDRPSTRVHAPPGGRSQINFGSDKPASKSPVPTAATAPASAATLAASSELTKATPKPATQVVKQQRTSSNAYASGSNQNAGNVITDRPSTRVHAPPGGRSQIHFGGDEPASKSPVPAAATAPAGAAPVVASSELTKATPKPATQVVQQRRTSSNAYASGSNQNAGNVITDRPSTRVHAPPGGRSQIHFGGDEPASKSPVPTAAPAPAAATVVASSELTKATPKPATQVVKHQRTSSNAYASGSNQNAGNVITDRPSTRVHAPPGGRSQIHFGDDESAAAGVQAKTPSAVHRTGRHRRNQQRHKNHAKSSGGGGISTIMFG